MAHYRKNAANDRDALFGGLSSGGSNSGGSRSKGGGTTSSSSGDRSRAATSRPAPSPAAAAPSSDDPMARLREMKKNKNRRPAMSGELRETKLKEAKEYKDKGNKCMQKTFLGPKPDPVAASTFYKRAADAYQQIGDMPREERLYRLQSAQCNELIQAWASVAHDYTRAAELLQQQMDDGVVDETIANPGEEAAGYHRKASHAWTQLGEKSKAAGCQIKAAVAVNSGPKHSRNLSKQALTSMEEAIEAHVPDVFNPFARYRQTGHSAFIDPESEETVAKPSPETLELAREHIVTASYSHEPLQELVYMLVEQYREYPTALYACGAASALLEKDGNSTISLSRSYVTETILLLAIGDAVAAQEVFLKRHVQRTSYLNSRECKLSEELFRAILDRDPEALDEVRSPAGSNKAALANLHSSLRQLVKELRVSGVARKKKTATEPSAAPKATKSKPKSPKTTAEQPSAAAAQDATLSELMNMKTGYEKEVDDGAKLDGEALASELDDLDFGLGDDDDEGGEDDDDDDDIDLR